MAKKKTCFGLLAYVKLCSQAGEIEIYTVSVGGLKIRRKPGGLCAAAHTEPPPVPSNTAAVDLHICSGMHTAYIKAYVF